MTTLDAVLSRALLAFDRTVPRDTVPTRDTTWRGAVTPRQTTESAADDLRALCETVVRHTPATAVGEFVTDQIPAPRAALVLACVLQLSDTDDGARFWWQYAAGAGQPAAAYCLYLHHLALGETHVASWWHTQTNEAGTCKPASRAPAARTEIRCADDPGLPALLQAGDGVSTTTLLRVLRQLARHVTRQRSSVVMELMAYMPLAVASGYLREPDSEIPLPGPNFARQVRDRLNTADRSLRPSGLPPRSQSRHRPRPGDDRHQCQRDRHADEAATR
ncbi:hypothetical protein ACFV2V_16850 [Streptomyces sp. NPDC059698]|uniref:hypothetical protein n=1 Tax=unclassified Streptomyces TaxID=2593676 RepID=UPI00093DA522|nr:hypothetical protein [Streptomyces sp. CB02366]